MTPRSRSAIWCVILAASAVLVAGCDIARRGPTYPPAGASPIVATGQTAAARVAVSAALGSSGLQVADAIQAYRPPEGAWLAAAPRTVLELDAPGEGALGFVILYAFGSPTDAASAGADQAGYVSRGPGRVYFALDTHFTIRVLGSAVIFFAWSPGTGDPRLADVEAAFGTVGTGVAIPA